MATQMISQMDPLTDDLADDDLLVIVDSSDLTDSPNGTTKRMDAQQVIAKKLKTTTGPTVLAIGAVADGEFLKRVGSTVVGATPSNATTIIDETGAPLTIDGSHDGAVVLVDDDVTVPSGLGAGFSVMLIQTGASPVEIIESSTTVNNRQGHVHIADQFGVVTLFAYAANTFVLGGDTAT